MHNTASVRHHEPFLFFMLTLSLWIARNKGPYHLLCLLLLIPVVPTSKCPLARNPNSTHWWHRQEVLPVCRFDESEFYGEYSRVCSKNYFCNDYFRHFSPLSFQYHFVVRTDANYERLVRGKEEQFAEHLTLQLSGLLKVPKSSIQNLIVSKGSVVIKFTASVSPNVPLSIKKHLSVLKDSNGEKMLVKEINILSRPARRQDANYQDHSTYSFLSSAKSNQFHNHLTKRDIPQYAPTVVADENGPLFDVKHKRRGMGQNDMREVLYGSHKHHDAKIRDSKILQPNTGLKGNLGYPNEIQFPPRDILRGRKRKENRIPFSKGTMSLINNSINDVTANKSNKSLIDCSNNTSTSLQCNRLGMNHSAGSSHFNITTEPSWDDSFLPNATKNEISLQWNGKSDATNSPEDKDDVPTNRFHEAVAFTTKPNEPNSHETSTLPENSGEEANDTYNITSDYADNNSPSSESYAQTPRFNEVTSTLLESNVTSDFTMETSDVAISSEDKDDVPTNPFHEAATFTTKSNEPNSLETSTLPENSGEEANDPYNSTSEYADYNSHSSKSYAQTPSFKEVTSTLLESNVTSDLTLETSPSAAESHSILLERNNTTCKEPETDFHSHCSNESNFSSRNENAGTVTPSAIIETDITTSHSNVVNTTLVLPFFDPDKNISLKHNEGLSTETSMSEFDHSVPIITEYNLLNYENNSETTASQSTSVTHLENSLGLDDFVSTMNSTAPFYPLLPDSNGTSYLSNITYPSEDASPTNRPSLFRDNTSLPNLHTNHTVVVEEAAVEATFPMESSDTEEPLIDSAGENATIDNVGRTENVSSSFNNANYFSTLTSTLDSQNNSREDGNSDAKLSLDFPYDNYSSMSSTELPQNTIPHSLSYTNAFGNFWPPLLYFNMSYTLIRKKINESKYFTRKNYSNLSTSSFANATEANAQQDNEWVNSGMNVTADTMGSRNTSEFFDQPDGYTTERVDLGTINSETPPELPKFNNSTSLNASFGTETYGLRETLSSDWTTGAASDDVFDGTSDGSNVSTQDVKTSEVDSSTVEVSNSHPDKPTPILTPSLPSQSTVITNKPQSSSFETMEIDDFSSPTSNLIPESSTENYSQDSLVVGPSLSNIPYTEPSITDVAAATTEKQPTASETVSKEASGLIAEVTTTEVLCSSSCTHSRETFHGNVSATAGTIFQSSVSLVAQPTTTGRKAKVSTLSTEEAQLTTIGCPEATPAANNEQNTAEFPTVSSDYATSSTAETSFDVPSLNTIYIAPTVKTPSTQSQNLFSLLTQWETSSTEATKKTTIAVRKIITSQSTKSALIMPKSVEPIMPTDTTPLTSPSVASTLVDSVTTNNGFPTRTKQPIVPTTTKVTAGVGKKFTSSRSKQQKISIATEPDTSSMGKTSTLVEHLTTKSHVQNLSTKRPKALITTEMVTIKGDSTDIPSNDRTLNHSSAISSIPPSVETTQGISSATTAATTERTLKSLLGRFTLAKITSLKATTMATSRLENTTPKKRTSRATLPSTSTSKLISMRTPLIALSFPTITEPISTTVSNEEAVSLPVSFTMAASYDKVVLGREQRLRAHFIWQLIKVMRIPKRCIKRFKVERGSIVVSFDLVPNKGGDFVFDEETLKAARDELMRLVNSGQLKLTDLEGNPLVIIAPNPVTTSAPTKAETDNTLMILGIIMGIALLIAIITLVAIIIKYRGTQKLSPLEDAKKQMPSYRKIPYEELLWSIARQDNPKSVGKFDYDSGIWLGPGVAPFVDAPKAANYNPPSKSQILQSGRPSTSVRRKLRQEWQIDDDTLFGRRNKR